MLQLYVLGPFRAFVDDESIELPSRPAQSLLAYLALNPGIQYRRERLAGMFWPDSNEKNARNNLKQALWHVNSVLGQGYIIADRMTIAFDTDMDYWLDAAVVEAPLDGEDIDSMIEVVGLYQGALLQGFMDEWVTLERERLSAVYESRMRTLIDQLLEVKRWSDVIRWSEIWISQGQLPEAAYRALMTAHAALGDQARMVATYQRLQEDLDEALGILPSPQTRKLYEQLVTDQIDFEPAPLTTTDGEKIISKLPVFSTTFLGRDDEIAAIHRRLEEDSCRMLTLVGLGGIGKTRLAVHVASERRDYYQDGVVYVALEQVQTSDMLASTIGQAAGMTPGDVGSVESQVIMYLSNQQLLLVLDNMERLMDARHVLSDILQQAPEVTMLVTSRDRLNIQDEWIYPVQGLVIPTSPEVRTSAMELFIERARQIEPTYEPDISDLRAISDLCELVDGMPLGIELAASWVGMLSAPAIVSKVSANLDLLTKSKPIQRQGSLKAIFDYVWEQLSEVEQAGLRKSSILTGSFSFELLQVVTGASLTSLRALMDNNLLTRQANESFRLHNVIRAYAFEQLKTAPDLLEQAHHQLWAYYEKYLTDTLEDLTGGHITAGVEKLRGHIDKIRTGLLWAAKQGKISRPEEILLSLWLYFAASGSIQEGYALVSAWQARFEDTQVDQVLQWMLATVQLDFADGSQIQSIDMTEIVYGIEGRENQTSIFYVLALSLLQDTFETDQLLAVLDEAANQIQHLAHGWAKGVQQYLAGHTYLYKLNLYPQAAELLLQSEAIIRAIGDEYWLVRILAARGDIAFKNGDYHTALTHFEESLTLAEALNHPGMIAWVNIMTGRVYASLGEYSKAQSIYDRYLPDYRELRTPFMNSSVRFAAAQLATIQGDYETAMEQLKGTLQKPNETGTVQHINYLVTLANLQAARGQYDVADQTLDEAFEVSKRLNYQMALLQIFNLKSTIAQHQNQSALAWEYLTEALKISLQTGYVPESLKTLMTIARYLVDQGQFERAATLLTIILSHPASDYALTERATDLLMKVESDLTTQQIKTIQQLAPKLSLDNLIQDVLEDTSN